MSQDIKPGKDFSDRTLKAQTPKVNGEEVSAKKVYHKGRDSMQNGRKFVQTTSFEKGLVSRAHPAL